MAVYSLSARAATDLDGIYEYTISEFGLEQAREYLLGLHKRIEMLAGNLSSDAVPQTLHVT